MYLFGLEGSGFMISLGLTLLIAGAIMFYTLKRFSILENSIIEQGRVLHSFINKMQERDLEKAAPTTIASSIAIESANKQHVLMNDKTLNNYNNVTNNSDKISVSDNDESNVESSSEYDSDSENESIAVQEFENGDRKENVVNEETMLEVNNYDNTATNESVKIISIEDLQPDLGIVDAMNLHSSDSESNLDSSTNLDTNSVTDINNLDVLHIENEVKTEIKKGGVTKMKVSELRELVIEQGLVNSMEDAIKLKKDGLIKLLQNN